MLFEGSGVAIATPFNEDGSVDYTAYENLIDYHLKNNTDAIVACGTTAEATCLSEEEKLKLIDISIEKIGGKIPLIVGTGCNNTYESVQFSKKVSNIDGVDGLLVITPYYNKASKEGLYRHFETIAKNSSKDIILYNVPGRTNVNIDLDTLKRLAQIENIVGIKDATGDLDYTISIRKELPEDFAIYSGNDNLIVPIMSVGGNGVISVLANVIPNEVHNLIKICLDGDYKEAAKLQAKYYDLISALFHEVNPVGVKYGLSKIKLCKNELRLPLTKATKGTESLVDQAWEMIHG
ncbi:MAG: 4-hydroxy-tetrahydrodipicolinate synthase [Peptoniphilus sp.]|nr:4-hydroxy-tetrahydrodipicolinate synthase [Peptoniphilus sp.]MDD7362863.1 4-hydroxy-tetrahydrodipicolinate synthase [Bacillota bacterium]MDY6043945.1 4-hydroxy-tetrahydrodipicolinate synthase [Peptoniphilus sp.]